MSEAEKIKKLEGDLAALAERVGAVEGLAAETAKTVEALDGARAGADAAPHVQSLKDPLHPSKAGLPEYNELRNKLLNVKPHEKGYAEARAQLRAAGIVNA